eukprot:765150-Hanusia_phi.AAC.1
MLRARGEETGEAAGAAPFAIVVGSEGNRVDGRRGMRQARNEGLDLPRLVHVAVGQQPDLRAVGAGSCRPQRPQQATRHAPRASRADHLVLPHSLLRARARDPPSHAPQLLFRPPGKFPPAALPAAALPPADRTIAAMRIVALVESQELEPAAQRQQPLLFRLPRHILVLLWTGPSGRSRQATSSLSCLSRSPVIVPEKSTMKIGASPSTRGGSVDEVWNPLEGRRLRRRFGHHVLVLQDGLLGSTVDADRIGLESCCVGQQEDARSLPDEVQESVPSQHRFAPFAPHPDCMRLK